MIKSKYHVIGVMSGTSLDGVDLCYAYFHYDKSWSYKIIEAKTIPYSNGWVERLREAIHLNDDLLKDFDREFSVYLNSLIKKFIKKYSIENLDAICSHGHTIFHQPEKGYTCQIGNQPELAKDLNCKVVCDFRIADVALGGQGAPLVPIGDQLLFREYSSCLNLGGFANISSNKNLQRVAYDICPVNIILNYYTRSLGLDFDKDGVIAKSGDIDLNLLETLNNLSFYREAPPKSLGIEWVNTFVFPLIDEYKLPVNNILRTLSEHIAIQITNEINKEENHSKVLTTGGGAFNTFLMERIKHYSKYEVIVPSKLLVEYKEALIFGFLGILKLRGENNCLMSVTGALKDHSSGVVYN